MQNTNKPLYRLISSKGWIYLPKAMRQSAAVEPGDIVRLTATRKGLCVEKVEIVEVGSHTPETQMAYISAAIRQLPTAERQEILEALVAQQRGDREDAG